MELLYIHPAGHLNDLAIPAGALSCMNGVSVSKLGRYAFEVSEQEIRRARVVALDLHWALGLPGFVRLVSHIRALAPEAKVIAGGITAGFYASELLARDLADYVLHGDSEPGFAVLVEAILADEQPRSIANVFSRETPAPPRHRLSQTEFDGIDCLSAQWFPTYEMCAGWDAAAFPQGRLIPVMRGCPLRCPDCYGSFADTFGRGHLWRSPSAVVRDIELAAAAGLRNLRLFLGKPSAARLEELLQKLARAGPFRFANTVGLYLCRAPTPRDLERLEEAFAAPVVISLVPPTEHIPQLRPEAVELEEAAWKRAGELVQRSRHLQLDVWTSRISELERLRHRLGASPRGRIKVSSAAVWSVTRPTDSGPLIDFETLDAAMQPVWTFYAARLLSPALAELLEPFALLDELPADPSSPRELRQCMIGYHEAMMESWRRHSLPTIPGLSFSLVGLSHPPGSPTVNRLGEIRCTGQVGLILGRDLASPAALWSVPLDVRKDHRGVEFSASLDSPLDCDFLAFVPHTLPTAALDPASVEQMAQPGLVGLKVKPGIDASRCEVHLRVQDAGVALLDGDGNPVSRGRADLGYFSRPGPGLHQYTKTLSRR